MSEQQQLDPNQSVTLTVAQLQAIVETAVSSAMQAKATNFQPAQPGIVDEYVTGIAKVPTILFGAVGDLLNVILGPALKRATALNQEQPK